MISETPHPYSMCQFSHKDTDNVPSLGLLPIFSGPAVKAYLETRVSWPTTLLFPLTGFSYNVQDLTHIHMHITTHKANLESLNNFQPLRSQIYSGIFMEEKRMPPCSVLCHILSPASSDGSVYAPNLKKSLSCRVLKISEPLFLDYKAQTQ